ncbi:MAG: hypothetical protein ACI9F9_000234 [Candidatus Paceibacteria bacterium]|jgi:hypothetical protein
MVFFQRFLGEWRRQDANGFTAEHWVLATPGLMVGMGHTIRAGVLVSHESMQVQQRGADLVYIAQPGGSPVAIEFLMAELSENHILFENLEHDFPQWIRYEWMGPNRCHASVGAGSRSIEFDYVR